MQPGEFVVTTFWRRENGIEEMHVYTGYGFGSDGLRKAMAARQDMLLDYRVNHPVGPTPVVKVVKTIPMEGELWNRAQTQESRNENKKS